MRFTPSVRMVSQKKSWCHHPHSYRHRRYFVVAISFNVFISRITNPFSHLPLHHVPIYDDDLIILFCNFEQLVVMFNEILSVVYKLQPLNTEIEVILFILYTKEIIPIVSYSTDGWAFLIYDSAPDLLVRVPSIYILYSHEPARDIFSPTHGHGFVIIWVTCQGS